MTYFADHVKRWSHDTMNRDLRDDHLTPRLVWENVQQENQLSPNGYLVFDDTVLDKNFSCQIDLVRRQYRGNANAIINSIGLVNCVDMNPDMLRFWEIDDRIDDPDGDGKSKLQHVQDMFAACRLSSPFALSGRADGYVVCHQFVSASCKMP